MKIIFIQDCTIIQINYTDTCTCGNQNERKKRYTLYLVDDELFGVVQRENKYGRLLLGVLIII